MAPIDRIEYGGWQNCYRLSDGRTEAIVTADVGPRIIHYGFVGGENMLHQIDDDMGKTGGDEYRFYGGHRLWHAPEDKTRTYAPDNQPVDVAENDDGEWVFTAPVEERTGIQKALHLSFRDRALSVQHRLYNRNLWTVTFAPWALTQVAAGGTAILPLPERGSHEENLLPVSNLALWAYTNLGDPRWTFGREYILLRQDTKQPLPQKIGANMARWLGYVRQDTLFVKTIAVGRALNALPDLSSNVELFTDSDMLELETLQYEAPVAPGKHAWAGENWYLFPDVPEPHSDVDVRDHIAPLVADLP